MPMHPTRWAAEPISRHPQWSGSLPAPRTKGEDFLRWTGEGNNWIHLINGVFDTIHASEKDLPWRYQHFTSSLVNTK